MKMCDELNKRQCGMYQRRKQQLTKRDTSSRPYRVLKCKHKPVSGDNHENIQGGWKSH